MDIIFPSCYYPSEPVFEPLVRLFQDFGERNYINSIRPLECQAQKEQDFEGTDQVYAEFSRSLGLI